MRVAIFGASGAIGESFGDALQLAEGDNQLYRFTRPSPQLVDDDLIPIRYDDADLAQWAKQIKQDGPLDLIIIATGVLHSDDIAPEKSLRDIDAEQLTSYFETNTIIPAMIVKHFAPLLRKDAKSVCAVLSAKVGSISDNQLGGWYGYRMSKAALNMMIKNTAIEISRRNPNASIIALHPGTVDSNLSAPFQRNLPVGQVRNAPIAVDQMLQTLRAITPEQSGALIGYDGTIIAP